MIKRVKDVSYNLRTGKQYSRTVYLCEKDDVWWARVEIPNGKMTKKATGEKGIIKHIEFWVFDLKRSMRFYKGIFKLIHWDHVEKNAFSNGQTKIYFIEQKVEPQRTVGPRHICFLADSCETVDEIARFLIKNKSDIIRGPLEYQYRNRISYTIDFRDPDGYVIEVATKSVIRH